MVVLENISQRLDSALRKLRGKGVLNEQDVAVALKEVRLALLEADVNFKIVKKLIERIRERAIGHDVMKSLTPGHQVVKIVHETLTEVMGSNQSPLTVAPNPPTIIMLIGLQGSGKTTSAGKLARHFQKQNKRVLLTAADTRRPAAVQQLVSVGATLGISVHRNDTVPESGHNGDPVEICQSAIERAKKELFDVVLLDTGGRLQIDTSLMQELVSIRNTVEPNETLLVADAMMGQEAVSIADQFNQQIGLTGVVLTKMEGDTRGGAVLSIKEAIGKPIKFLGVGEKLDALEPFHPDRMASRILGMGDVLSLIDKAREAATHDALPAAKKVFRPDSLTFEDFAEQLKQLNKMGPLESIIDMLPGQKLLKGNMDVNADKKAISRTIAIVNSMTVKERRDHSLLSGRRKIRIATGSGTSVQEVNRLVKQFLTAKKMLKKMTGRKGQEQLQMMMRQFG
tara:strand:+ start:75 stop:1436 length:1362 start_codon:yes stop_codon:yes gene_type:complete